MRPIVFFSSHSLMIPVVKQLKDEFAIGVLDSKAAEMYNNLDIETVPMSKAMDAELRESALAESAKLIHAAVEFDDYGGLSPKVANFARQRMPAFLYPRVADLAAVVLAMDKMQPQLAVLHNDVEPVMRTIALWCKARGKKCLHVPHAVYQDINRGRIGTDIHDVVTASHLAAAGPFQREWYEKRGLPSINIKETGLPQRDKWVLMNYDRVRALRLLKLKPFVPTITYIASWRQNTSIFGCNDQWAQTYADFLEAVKKIEEPLQVLVQVTPSAGEESLKWHINMAKENNVHCVVTPSHLEICIIAADLVLAPFGSNTLIEAAVFPHTRLATMEGHGYVDDDVVAKFRHSGDGVAEGITAVLAKDPPDKTAFKMKYGGQMDGKAHVRVADYIRELMAC